MPAVLLIDDEEHCTKLVELLLYGTEFHLLCASSGAVAIDLLEKHSAEIVCILLDIVLPDINGLDLMRDIHDFIIDNNIPVIIQTSILSYVEIEAFYILGISGYLIKPYSRKELLDIINSVTLGNVRTLNKDYIEQEV